MLNLPKSLHQLHIFEKDDGLYAADLDKARIVEISSVIAEILKLVETQTTEEITQGLTGTYSKDEIQGAFETLTQYATQGLIFDRGQRPILLFPKETNLPRLLLVLPGFNLDTFFDF